MDLTSTLDAPHPPAAVFALVGDLTSYPRWLEIVTRVETAPAHESDGGPAWYVTLRARLGPLSRAKRLRMVQTARDAPHAVVFERNEADGREHSTWLLCADLDETATGTQLTMSLHYDGNLFDQVVERLLKREVDLAKTRLLGLLHM